MYRYVSLVLLVAVIAVLAFVFYKVMAGFFLPLFMAALLVVVFRPLHEWILGKVKGRPKIAAFLTTTAILVIVLLPFCLTVFFAAVEGRAVVRNLDPSTINDKFHQVRTKLGLDMPAFEDFERIERVIATIKTQPAAPNPAQQREQVQYDITEIRGLAIDLGKSLAEADPQINLQWLELPDQPAGSDEGKSAPEPVSVSSDQKAWQEFALELHNARDVLADEAWEKAGGDVDLQQEMISEARETYKSSIAKYFQFKQKLLGGPFRDWLKEIANPNPEELKGYIQKGTNWLRTKLVSFGGATTAFFGKFLFGVTIMGIALFSFLLDGPAMLNAVKGLTPLDDEHEDELIAEFDKVSRAVVLATLLSALAQGILAAIGFYFAGLSSIMLLFLLTCVLALVPFVGAAAVWMPAALWLAFVDARMGAGIFLAIYGFGVVSMADNVIKPFVLHGQSNLHPLWALLSVLGGVSALGPVGILIGPMIVAFLQTLLKILQREISSFDGDPNDEVPAIDSGSSQSQSGDVGEVTTPASDEST